MKKDKILTSCKIRIMVNGRRKGYIQSIELKASVNDLFIHVDGTVIRYKDKKALLDKNNEFIVETLKENLQCTDLVLKSMTQDKKGLVILDILPINKPKIL